MKLNAPTVGPIVGHTTEAQSRIFLRGQAEPEGSGWRRCFAAIRWRAVGSRKWLNTLFNKLSPNFDMTGVFVLDGLSAETEYEYQVGWFYADAELEKIQGLDATQIEWLVASHRFKTGTSNPLAARSYVVGSCRYLLRLFGGTYFDDRGDKVFRSILEQIKNGDAVSALLMIGDQIYADDLNAFSPDARMDEFLRRYRTVFSQENIGKLMAQTPTYMILDDHEIEDNWPSNATKKDRITLYPHAIHAYQIYQCSHGPLFAVADGRIEGTLTHFWYSFSDGCVDWFVLDARTERVVSDAGRRMISDRQMEALRSWLNDGSGRIKFVVSSVPVFPDLLRDSGDKWGGFPEQRAAILEHIFANKINKVVFVSGDVHCSFVSRLSSPTDASISVHSIISSSFFWPYPHTEQSDFIFDKPLQNSGTHQYHCQLVSPVHSDDNFARIEATPTNIGVTFYKRKGDPLGPTLKLAP